MRPQHAHQYKRHSEGRCYREGCTTPTAHPDAWRCPDHAAEFAAYQRAKRAKLHVEKPARGDCACGAKPLTRQEKCAYYKSETHFFPKVDDAG